MSKYAKGGRSRRLLTHLQVDGITATLGASFSLAEWIFYLLFWSQWMTLTARSPMGRVHMLKYKVSWNKAEVSSSSTPIHYGVSSLKIWLLLSSWWDWDVVTLLAWSANVSWLPSDRLKQAHPLPDAGKNSISGNNAWRMPGGEVAPAWTESKTADGWRMVSASLPMLGNLRSVLLPGSLESWVHTLTETERSCKTTAGSGCLVST